MFSQQDCPSRNEVRIFVGNLKLNKSASRITNAAWIIVFLILQFASPHSLLAQTNPSKPNVIMICVDDLNDWVGYLANETDHGLLDILITNPAKRQQLKNYLTPNIDRLAESSVAFTRAYANCPLCGASRVSFLTGLRPSTTGYYDQNEPFRTSVRNSDAIVTLPQYLKQQGYMTVEAGKIFHHSRGGNPNAPARAHSDPQSWSAQHVQWCGTKWSFLPNRIKGRHCAGNPWQFDPATTKEVALELRYSPAADGAELPMSKRWHAGRIKSDYFSRFFNWGVLPEPGNRTYSPCSWGTLEKTFDFQHADYVASFVSNLDPKLAAQKFTTDIKPGDKQIIAGLPTRKPGQPYFIGYGGRLPHDPFIVPASFKKSLLEIISPEDLNIEALERLNKNLCEHPSKNSLGQIGPCAHRLANVAGLYDAIIESGQAQHGDRHYYWREAVFMYLASVNFSDTCIGRILDGLEQSPEKDNTIVIMLSDHGYHLGTKNHWSKMTLWEESTHVPFIIKAPKIEPAICKQPVDLLSIYATVLELTGLPAPHQLNSDAQVLDSVSIVPLLEEPASRWSRPVISSYQFGSLRKCFSAVTERWKFISYSNNNDNELYDLQNDPYELKNILRDELPATAESMQAYQSLRRLIENETKHGVAESDPENRPAMIAPMSPVETAKRSRSSSVKRSSVSNQIFTHFNFVSAQTKPETGSTSHNNPTGIAKFESQDSTPGPTAAVLSLIFMLSMFFMASSMANLELGATKKAAGNVSPQL